MWHAPPFWIAAAVFLVGCSQPDPAPSEDMRAVALAGPNKVDVVPTTLSAAARGRGAALLTPTGDGYVIAWADEREALAPRLRRYAHG